MQWDFLQVSEVIAMITKEEIEKIETANKKSMVLTYIWAGIDLVMIIIGVLALIFLPIKSVLEIFAIIIYILIFSLPPVGIIETVSRVKPSLRVVLTNNGLLVPYPLMIHKKQVFINYEWIECVVLNENNEYFVIFFSKDGRKYTYSYQQTAIDNYIKFVTELRKRGIEVKILEPSIKYQKQDFKWLRDKTQGRVYAYKEYPEEAKNYDL